MLVCTFKEGIFVVVVNYATTVGNKMEVLQKTKTKNAVWYSNSTIGHLLRDNENTNLKRYMYPYNYGCIVYISQDMKAIQMSINRRMAKEDVVCVHTHIHNVITLPKKKRKRIKFLTTWMGIEAFIHYPK